MKRIFIAIVFASLYIGGAAQTKVKLDNSTTITLNLEVSQDQSLQAALKQANKNIVYAAAIYPPGANKASLLAVSKYFNDDAYSIDSVFSESVKHVPANAAGGYTLVDHGTYEKDGKTLRFKESRVTFESGQEVYNLMYYFMRGSKSTEYYEVKISGGKEDMDRSKAIMEQILLSVSFE